MFEFKNVFIVLEPKNIKRWVRVFLICISMFQIFPTAASTSDAKVLYLADWFSLIWKMDIETQQTQGSFSVEQNPIGLALLDGVLYVSSTVNMIFAFNPDTGDQLSAYKTNLILDGLAAIPEVNLIAGIEPSNDGFEEKNLIPSKEKLHFYRINGPGDIQEETYNPVEVDVPGNAVRALAYAEGEIYISEETTQKIYVYRVDIKGKNVLLTYDRELPIGFSAPGLVADCNKNLVAYDIGNELIRTVSPTTGETISSFSLTGTGISNIVAGLVLHDRSCLSGNNNKLKFRGLKLLGKTIGKWAAGWWKWQEKNFPGFAFGDGMVDCSKGQKGPVWYLGGTGGGAASRECKESIPKGKYLMFPLVNGEISNPDDWCKSVGDGDSNCTVMEKREILDGIFSEKPEAIFGDNVNSVPCKLQAEVDGFPLMYSTSIMVRTQTPTFKYDDDRKAVADGIWVVLPPLSKGDHTIHFTGGICDIDDTSNVLFSVEVTYKLTVGNDLTVEE